MFDRLSEITLALARKGGGGGGSTNYNDLDHKPKINNVELAGSLLLSDLGAQGELTSGTGINITGSTISVDADSAPTNNSQKPVTSGGTKSAIDASQNTSLQMLEDTVGWTGKNLLANPYSEQNKTVNGITYTMLSDGTVIANGTASANSVILLKNKADLFSLYEKYKDYDLVLSGTPASGGSYKYIVQIWDSVHGTQRDVGSGISLPSHYLDNSADGNIALFVYSGQTLNNVVFKPMLRLATVSDDTFEPYHASVENVLQDAEVTPSKNLLPYNATNETSSTGVICTIDENGILINANANTSAQYFKEYGQVTLPAGSYIYTDDSNSTSSTWFINAIPDPKTGTSNVNLTADVQPYEFTLTQETQIAFNLYVRSGVKPTNVRFKPMIRDASESDPAYKPYYVPLKDSKFDRAEQRVLGAKNLLDILTKGHTSDGIQGGVTIATNSDGTITFSNTATAQVDYVIGNTDDGRIPLSDYPSKMILSKGSNISSDNIRMQVWYYDSSKTYTHVQNEINDGEGEFELKPISGDAYFAIDFRVFNGKSTNTTIKPMLRLASDPDDTYAPYAMTNKELTDGKANTSAIAPVENGSTASQAYALGAHFMRNGQFCIAKTAIASGATLVENSNYTVGDVADSLSAVSTVLTIASNSDISKLKQGINAVKLSSGMVIGTLITTPITLDNNYRGMLLRDGNNIMGFITDYISSNIYEISSTKVTEIEVARVLYPIS